jgi:hypothetical protein
MVSEAVVRKIIGVEGAEALINITDGAWQDYVNENVTRFHRSTRANVVWDYMAKRSDAMLSSWVGVERVESQGRPMYVLRDKVLLRPKLHTRDATTRNYPTKTQREVDETGLFPQFNYDVISFGYTLDRAEAGIESFIISCPSNSWLINLQELANGELSPVAPFVTGMEEDLTSLESIQRGA